MDEATMLSTIKRAFFEGGAESELLWSSGKFELVSSGSLLFRSR